MLVESQSLKKKTQLPKWEGDFANFLRRSKPDTYRNHVGDSSSINPSRTPAYAANVVQNWEPGDQHLLPYALKSLTYELAFCWGDVVSLNFSAAFQGHGTCFSPVAVLAIQLHAFAADETILKETWGESNSKFQEILVVAIPWGTGGLGFWRS